MAMTAMPRLFGQIDRLLRGQAGASKTVGEPMAALFAGAIAAGMTYGAVMGAFSLRPMQMLYAAVKVPMMLGITFLISLPSFFMLNTVLGLRGDFRRTMTALLDALAMFTLTLLSLAPLTIFWYLSSGDYEIAILFNGLMFAIALFTAQLMLRRRYRPLIAAQPKHAWVLRGWLITFTFVGIQMAWVLRPFVGNPHAPTRFFREGAWSNAYEFVGEMVWHVVTRSA
jgi:hypothetical protein